MVGVEPGEARTYLGREMEWSGLLTGRTIGELEFVHLVLGEYLVAELLSELGREQGVGRRDVVGDEGGAATRNGRPREETEHARALGDVRHLVVIVQPRFEWRTDLVHVRLDSVARVGASGVLHLGVDDEPGERPHVGQFGQSGVDEQDEPDHRGNARDGGNGDCGLPFVFVVN